MDDAFEHIIIAAETLDKCNNNSMVLTLQLMSPHQRTIKCMGDTHESPSASKRRSTRGACSLRMACARPSPILPPYDSQKMCMGARARRGWASRRPRSQVMRSSAISLLSRAARTNTLSDDTWFTSVTRTIQAAVGDVAKAGADGVVHKHEVCHVCPAAAAWEPVGGGVGADFRHVAIADARGAWAALQPQDPGSLVVEQVRAVAAWL